MVDDELIGQVLASRYKVLEKMGEGGMGTVYLARHVAIEKRLALKVLLPEYARKPDLKERFLREARAAAAIDHQNIVDITDFGETPTNSVFFAMEYLSGKDLSHHIKDDGPFPWARTKRIAQQICRALGAAHAKEIIHRDMKPENVFLIDRENRPDFVKVLDFGIAKVSGAADGEHRLTRTGMIFGTPEYMSPEQAQGHFPDHRVDIYAVGVIMYEMLTGKVPFKADTFMGILTKHIFEDPVPPTEMAPEAGIPLDVEEIVLKAMAKDRDERFQSMTEMATAVSQATGQVTRATGEVMPARVLSSAGSTGADGRVAVPRAAGSLPRVAAETDVQFEPQLPTGRGRTLALVALALLLVGGGVAAAIFGSGQTAEEPTQPRRTTQPAATTVTIVISSTPPGAKVFKGTELLGTTPARVRIPKSERSIMLTFSHTGYRDHRQPVVPSGDKDLQVALVPLQPVAKAPAAASSSAAGQSPRAATKAPAAHNKRAATASRRPGTASETRRRRGTASETRRRRRTPPDDAARRPATKGPDERRPAAGRRGRGASQRVEDLINPFQ